MSSAIEVLESEKVLYIEKIKEIKSRFNGMPFDIKESYQKSVKVYQEFIDALGEALLALEQKEKLIEWLEKEITSNEDKIKLNIAFAQSYSGVNNGIMCEKDFLDDIEKIEIENRILKEVLERVGEQK